MADATEGYEFAIGNALEIFGCELPALNGVLTQNRERKSTGRRLMLVSRAGCSMANISILGAQTYPPKRKWIQRRSIWTHVTLSAFGIARLRRPSKIIDCGLRIPFPAASGKELRAN
ncbi:hypothetical protein ACTXT7_000032 [Hymenolepis weldensis]